MQWIWASTAIWIFDRVVRLLRLAHFNLHLSRTAAAHIEALGQGRRLPPPDPRQTGIDGLYGHTAPVHLYDRVFLIAGGIGITTVLLLQWINT